MQQITIEDVRRAFKAHVECLEACGIVYDGRLVLSEGSKYYGNAYQINLTDKMDRCQARPWNDPTNHGGCAACGGSGMARCSGHYRPPVGDDFLGMTKREAFETLTARTRAIYDTHTAMVKA